MEGGKWLVIVKRRVLCVNVITISKSLAFCFALIPCSYNFGNSIMSISYLLDWFSAFSILD